MAVAGGKGKQNGTDAQGNTVLSELAELLHQRAEVFANVEAVEGVESSKDAIRKKTLEATKYLFEQSLKDEAESLPALSALLADVRDTMASSSIETRSKAAKNKQPVKQPDYAKWPIFQPTPLQTLYLGSLEQENGKRLSAIDLDIQNKMIWEQIDMRIGKVLDIYREIVKDGNVSDEENDDAQGQEELEDEDDLLGMDGASDEDEEDLEGDDDVSDDELGREDYEDDDDLTLVDDDLEEDEESGMEEDEDDEEQPVPSTSKSEPYFAKLRDDSSSSSNNERRRRKTTTETAPGKTPLDEGFFSLDDFNKESLTAEAEMRRYMSTGKSKSVADLQDQLDMLDGGDDDENAQIDYFAPAGPSAIEGEDEDMDEDLGEDAARPEDMKYDDFWNPPKMLYGDNAPLAKRAQKAEAAKAHQAKKGKGKQELQHQEKSSKRTDRRVSFHDDVKVQEFEKDKPGKQSAIALLVKKVGMKEAMQRLSAGEVEDDDDDSSLVFDEEDEDAELDEGSSADEDEDGDEEEDGSDAEEDEGDSDAESAASDGADAGMQVMRRVQSDLLLDDDDESTGKKDKKSLQSRYEQRMAALNDQIAELEAENVAEKDWVLKGETNSRARPVNSLLEEDLEFDQVAKVVPVVTEESTQTLEDKIKKRILDEQFDDVVRKRVHKTAEYLPSRLLDIKDTQSDRSLAEIYADEFAAERQRAAGGPEKVPEIDAKLKKEHDSIAAIFEEISNKLDALSNARFTPKPVQTAITTVSNLPSVSLESALPTAASTSTLLAPEEVYAPAQKGGPISNSEMTPSQKRAARVKARKARMTTLKSIQKYGGSTSSVKSQKERAMNSLVGKRGVTVVGKGKAAKSALTGKDRQAKPAPAVSSGTALKL